MVPTETDVEDWWKQMPKEIPEYSALLTKLKPILFGLPPKIIAISGRDGVGKTTLGRFLSWTFNVTLIETDLYFISNTGTYDSKSISTLIEKRIQKNLPVIIDGIRVLEVLKSCNHERDYLIHCEDPKHSNSPELKVMIETYEAIYKPKENADFEMRVTFN
jgi:Cdc6-like AAA superfamily ATPase